MFYVPLVLNSPIHTYSVLFTVFCNLLPFLQALGIPQCVVHSLYGSETRGPEDDSVESKNVALISHYMCLTLLLLCLTDLHLLLLYKHCGMEHLKFK